MTRLVIALAFAGVTAATAAFAHAYPKTETPHAKSTVHTAPSDIVIEFDDELEPAFSSIVVRDAHGVRVDAGPAHIAPDDAKRLSVAVKPLGAGTYTVIWAVTDTDSHKTKGEYSFTVRP